MNSITALNSTTTRKANVLNISGGDSPSITLENRFKTAAVTYDGKRIEFMKTIVQRVTVSDEMYNRLVNDVKMGDQIEVTVKFEDGISKLDDFRIINS